MTALDFATVNAAARGSMQNLLAALLPGGRRQGREWLARNPKRADQHIGSFSINMDTGVWSDFATGDAGGDIVSLYAFLHDLKQGEAAQQLASDLGISDAQTVAGLASVAGRTWKNPQHKAGEHASEWRTVMPVPDDAPDLEDSFIQRFANAGYTLTAKYPYTSATDAWLGTVARYDHEVEGLSTDKEFRTFVLYEGPGKGRAWRCQGFPILRPLFGLHQLALRSDAPVLVTEGEKSAEAARLFFPDYVAVTSPNGSKSAAKADWSVLAGRNVVIWPDADESGAAYAQDVAEAARAAGANAVRIVQLPPDLPAGWDLADAFPNGMNEETLKAILQSAAEHPGHGPLPLFHPLPPAEPYPINALGPVLADAAAAIARKVQVPSATAGQSVLAAAALAAQAHADVLLPFGQTRPLSLFLITVAASGDRKSTADNEALWPVHKREKVLREDHTRDLSVWRIVQATWAAEKKQIEGDKALSFDVRKQKLQGLGDEPARPLSPFLITGDLTIEGLTKNWPHAHAALGIFTAEAGTFTGGHGMSDEARLRTAAMLSEVWDGKPIKRVRALDGVTILPGRRLSMHLMVQPDAAAGFLGNGTLRDQGLLSRVLVAAPASLAGTRFHRDTSASDEAAIRAYGARLLCLLEASPRLVPGSQNELDPPALSIDPEAKAALVLFADHIERQCASLDGLRPIGDFAAKAAEHAARIAGVLAIVDSQRATTISIKTMANALQLADWYVVETLRMHQAGRRDPKLLQAQMLLEWLHGRRDTAIDFRTMLQLGPAPLRTKRALDEVVAILMAHGWLREISVRPRRFAVQPSKAQS